MYNKKIIKLLLIFSLVCINNIYGISDDFKFVIDTIGIPRYNVYMNEINEDIYNTYNVFVYSDPQNLFWHNDQRFKVVSDFGKWTRINGSYKGYGERGEYYLLGTSYSGKIISNVYFPADYLPESLPNNWNYLITIGAFESWLDKGKYKYIEQLEYMKNTELLFDEINYNMNTINSYKLISYGISVNKIGMDKITLNTASTWKTNGIVTARRLTDKSKVRNAIFTTAPIASNASVLSILKAEDEFSIKESENEILIPLEISAEAVNLSKYAKEKHIKDITSVLYVNNEEIGRISGSKTLKVDKKIYYRVSRDNYKIPKTYPIDIKVKSYLYTEFSVDGLMQNEIKKTIKLHVLKKEVIPIKNLKLAVLEKKNKKLVIRPLVQTIITNDIDSEGIIEKGKFLSVRIAKNSDSLNFKCYINEKQVDYEKVLYNENYIILKIYIDESIENTIKSWNYLRDKVKNYFDIDFSKIGERITQPNILKIVCDSNFSIITKFDTIDKFSYNINYKFKNNVLNSEEVKKVRSLESWIENEN